MKIEIMDLLHKIYNLDDMPGKIIFDNCVWRYCSEFQDYQSERGYLFGDYMSHINETGKFLNDKAEILEEDKPIIESISITGKDIHKLENLGIYNIIEDIEAKLNEVIEFLNRKEDK